MNLFTYLSIICASFLFVSIASLENLCTPNPKSDNITCQIEIKDYTNSSILTSLSNLTIIEYNIDRNAYGGDSPYEKGIDNIISLFDGNPLPTPDILIMSELARDCKNFGNQINGADHIAKQLNLFYAFAVEYIEEDGVLDHQCTIGNAIFSKYKLTNIEQIRFVSQCCKFDGRWGGRITIFADLILANEKIISFYSTHLESGKDDTYDIISSLNIRFEQIKELIAHAKDNKYSSDYTIIGGDFNAPFGDIDSVSLELKSNDYFDSHEMLSYFDRNTCPFDTLAQYDIFVFDYIFIKGKKFRFHNSYICNLDYNNKCYGASDHLPIITNVQFF